MALGKTFLTFLPFSQMENLELGFSDCQLIPKLLEYEKIDSL